MLLILGQEHYFIANELERLDNVMNDLLKKYNDYMRLENFTDIMVKNSVFFSVIKERYEKFSYENLTTLTYTDAIINFNPTFIKSKIKSDYLLFEEKENNTYNHLGIAFNKNMGERYIETFFYQPNDMYITGQSISKISKFTLYDAENRIMVSDSF